MEEKTQHLLQPLLQPITTTNSAIYHPPSTVSTTLLTVNKSNITSSNVSIIVRLGMVIIAGVVSLWANYEASKGFTIAIINEADDTFAGRRFDLFYVSNDEVTRLLLKTSTFVENILYPCDGQLHDKKQLKHVMLRLSSRNLTSPTSVESRVNDEFVLHISPSILESPNYKHDMFLELQKGMARIWLWDGQGNAPASLVNGMIEYITSLAMSKSGSVESVALTRPITCWKDKDSIRNMVEFLNYCESVRQGFVRRLNQAMKNGWHEKMVDDALGIPAWHLCDSSSKMLNSV